MSRRLTNLERQLHRRIGSWLTFFAVLLVALVAFAVIGSRDAGVGQLAMAIVASAFFAAAGLVGWRIGRDDQRDGAWLRIGTGLALVAAGFVAVAVSNALG